MKKILVAMSLAAFVLSAPLAMAAEMKVDCCKDKKCSKVADKAACDKEGGKVVKDCKECK